jgi:hypothetical protein
MTSSAEANPIIYEKHSSRAMAATTLKALLPMGGSPFVSETDRDVLRVASTIKYQDLDCIQVPDLR